MSGDVYMAEREEVEYDLPASPVHTFNTLYSKGFPTTTDPPPTMGRLKQICTYDPFAAAFHQPPDHPDCLRRLREYDGPQPPPPGQGKDKDDIITDADPGDQQPEQQEQRTRPNTN